MAAAVYVMIYMRHLPLSGFPEVLSTRMTLIGCMVGAMTDVKPTQPTLLLEFTALALPSVAP